MSAKDVVAKAKGQGIKLSISQVYTARSSAKKRAGTAGTAGRAPRYSGASNAGDEAAFRRLVVAIGVRRADELLADFKRSVGL
ncbi:MAG: hypothetical protein OXU20_11990 [Myxococcales bacterium]|nr:hypothetical protein [Myxococcales bacterium]MDD9970967.1 hypothetical protein [Myxococcales bacterium]